MVRETSQLADMFAAQCNVEIDKHQQNRDFPAYRKISRKFNPKASSTPTKDQLYSTPKRSTNTQRPSIARKLNCPMPQACSTFIDKRCEISKSTDQLSNFFPVASSTMNGDRHVSRVEKETLAGDMCDTVVIRYASLQNIDDYCSDDDDAAQSSSGDSGFYGRYKSAQRLHSTANETMVPSIHLDTSSEDDDDEDSLTFAQARASIGSEDSTFTSQNDSCYQSDDQRGNIPRATTTPDLRHNNSKVTKGKKSILKKFKSLPNQIHRRFISRSRLPAIDENDVAVRGATKSERKLILKRIQMTSKTLKRPMPSSVATLAIL